MSSKRNQTPPPRQPKKAAGKEIPTTPLAPQVQLSPSKRTTGQSVSCFSEDSEPSPCITGVNRWLPVPLQWVCVTIIFAATLSWLVTGYMDISPEQQKLHKLREMSQWAPLLLMWLVGYPLLYGFISKSPSFDVWFNYVLHPVLFVVFKHFDAVVPYLTASSCAIFLYFPVLSTKRAGISFFDYDDFSIGTVWSTAISNPITYLLVKNGKITEHSRWVFQSVGWPLLVASWVFFVFGHEQAYRINRPQFVRYAFCLVSIYMFMYAGLCRSLEELILPSTG